MLVYFFFFCLWLVKFRDLIISYIIIFINKSDREWYVCLIMNKKFWLLNSKYNMLLFVFLFFGGIIREYFIFVCNSYFVIVYLRY